jgi:hypothetical protein
MYICDPMRATCTNYLILLNFVVLEIWSTLNIMKLLLMQFSYPSSHFFPPLPALKHRQFLFLS